MVEQQSMTTIDNTYPVISPHSRPWSGSYRVTMALRLLNPVCKFAFNHLIVVFSR